MGTKFDLVYNCFYSKITDDMYMELDEQQTAEMARELLLNAIPWFEFPRVDLYNYDLANSCFTAVLSNEEMNILATYMIVGWLDQQLASVEVTRMKYSGSDFKFTSQANHMSKLLTLKKDFERTGHHLQRLYKRRKAGVDGIMRSTMRDLMASSVREQNVPARNTAPVAGSGGGRPGSTPGTGGTDDNNWEDMDSVIPDNHFGGSGSNADEGNWNEMPSLKPTEPENDKPTQDSTWDDMEPLPGGSTPPKNDGWDEM